MKLQNSNTVTLKHRNSVTLELQNWNTAALYVYVGSIQQKYENEKSIRWCKN
jgi:hypothetical protein